MMPIRLAGCLLFLISTFSSAAEQKSNLCNSTEKLVFSCSIGKKFVSLCSTPNLTAKTGRLSYRFGVPGRVPDLVFSNDESGPATAFTTHFQTGAKWYSSSITFKRGEFSYTIYNGKAVYEVEERDNGGGVRVFRNGKETADLWCKDETIVDHLWQSLYELKFPMSSPP